MATCEINVHNYRLGDELGSGSFGQIFKGHSRTDPSKVVAIKLEENNVRYPQLAWEYRIYTTLRDSPYVPKVLWYGEEGNYKALIMEFLGKSIERQLGECGGTLTEATVRQVGVQMVRCVQSLHQHGFVHRDIKPDNFITESEHGSKILIIDFGLSKRFRRNGQHIRLARSRGVVGTARYASIRNHEGFEQSRRDDIESIGYILVYLLKGRLPWQGLNIHDRDRRNASILYLKKHTAPAELIDGLPKEFGTFIEYARRLDFEDTPDYEFLCRLLRADHSVPMDWCKPNRRFA